MLSNELRAAVRALSEEVMRDERYIRFRETRKALEEDPDMTKAVDESRRAYMELLKSGNEDGNLHYRQKDFMDGREELWSEPKARRFLKAEYAVSALIRDVLEEFMKETDMKGPEQDDAV